MDLISDITGVILCGGKSSRFGSDKAFARYHGQRFFDRIFRVMSRVFRDIVVVTHDPKKYRGVPALVLKDEIPHQGPIGGIITALRAVHRQGGGTIFVVACDIPLVGEAVIRRLLERDDGSQVLAYCQETRIEPLCALYRVSLLPLLESRQRAGIRGLQFLSTAGMRVHAVPLCKHEQRMLLNVNTRADLAQLEEQEVFIETKRF